MALFRHIASGTYPGGEVWSFTLHTQGSPTIAAAEALWLSSVTAGWTGHWDALVSTQVSWTGTKTAQLDTVTLKQMTAMADVVVKPGLGAGEPLPPQCSNCVSTLSALATRSGRGRFYLPPLTITTMATGHASGATVTALVAGAKAMFDALIAGGLAPVLVNSTTKVVTPITSFKVGNVIDTQRRRRDKLVETYTASPL
jgi:hypothetical protein